METAEKSIGRLSVTNLGLMRGSNLLFDGITFSANDGDLIWISGANGVGKTSLLKCLAGLLRPDHGDISWDDQPPHGATNRISFHGHNDGHKPNLTVEENLEFWNALYQNKADLDVILRQLDIEHLKDLKAKNLSAGQSRRVAIARLLLKNSKYWLLDEPNAPMDQAGRDLISDIVGEHLANSGIAIIASHRRPDKIGPNTRHMTLNRANDE